MGSIEVLDRALRIETHLVFVTGDECKSPLAEFSK